MPYPTPSVWMRVSYVTHFHYKETGPLTDSETDGYYMRMVTGTGKSSDSYYLLSPRYPKELSQQKACFSFRYYMFGRGVDSLIISVAPDSDPINGTIHRHSINGSQEADWLTGCIPIPKMEQDFRVVFTGKNAGGQFADIAIDDVELMPGYGKHQFHRKQLFNHQHQFHRKQLVNHQQQFNRMHLFNHQHQFHRKQLLNHQQQFNRKQLFNHQHQFHRKQLFNHQHQFHRKQLFNHQHQFHRRQLVNHQQ
ncbi:MAM and LDL-receptor class A domain-containing protein 1-like [Drosophila biarmipes]|uniref:MAM and LDL-receptor class A domain-containing protein 1-like n=1 Tax=Drosophila biarmipes TaxID=125945 RepID=UPI0021CCB051|nr:MAM and LDL-receptor class A domain-containing protein 1-like [Drosophila biarmipes]